MRIKGLPLCIVHVLSAVQAQKQALETYFYNSLVQHLLTQPEHQCKVDEFIAAYPTLPTTKLAEDGGVEIELLHRGDLVRCVRPCVPGPNR